MYEASTQIRVRYGETDQMGYVYYGNYATYYEVARVEALRQIGFAYKSLEDLGVMMPVVDLQSKYKQPAYYDDLLTIKVTIPEMPVVKMRFLYEITNEKGAVINVGETTLFFASMSNGKPTRIPSVLKDLCQPYFE